jgi:hypothetical protein
MNMMIILGCDAVLPALLRNLLPHTSALVTEAVGSDEYVVIRYQTARNQILGTAKIFAVPLH